MSCVLCIDAINSRKELRQVVDLVVTGVLLAAAVFWSPGVLEPHNEDYGNGMERAKRQRPKKNQQLQKSHMFTLKPF